MRRPSKSRPRAPKIEETTPSLILIRVDQCPFVATPFFNSILQIRTHFTIPLCLLFLALSPIRAADPNVNVLVDQSLNPGEIDPIKALLDTHPVDINARSDAGLTALQAARLKGHAELA